MKVIAVIVTIISIGNYGFAQGLLNFANSASTLISANGTPMPVAGTQQFIFALFLAPSTKVNTAGMAVGLADPNFQFTEVYNTNSALGTGRLVSRNGISVGGSQGYPAGSTVDFVVRGWSANAGETWTEALSNWNNGSPLAPMFIGSSLVGNDFLLVGGTVPTDSVFGISAHQVPGFDMSFVPEPWGLALAVLGGVTLLVKIRCRKRRPK
jgi:hypothetical protein